MLVEFGEQLRICGRYDEAESALAEALARGTDERVGTLAALLRLRIWLDSDPAVDVGAIEVEVRRAAEVSEALGDDTVAAEAWDALAEVSYMRCRYAAAAEADRHAAAHAERAGERDEQQADARALRKSCRLETRPNRE